MRINHVGAVHAAGAASHNKASEALQQGLEVDFVQELVLGGYMPSAKHNPVGLAHKLRGFSAVTAVQHDDFRRFDPGVQHAGGHPLQHAVGELFIVRGGAHHQDARPAGLKTLRRTATGSAHRLQLRLDGGQKAIVRGEPIFAVAGGTACED